LCSALLLAQTGCFVGKNGGPPGLPGLPGLPGPHGGKLPTPSGMSLAVEDSDRNHSQQLVHNEKSVSTITANEESYE